MPIILSNDVISITVPTDDRLQSVTALAAPIGRNGGWWGGLRAKDVSQFRQVCRAQNHLFPGGSQPVTAGTAQSCNGAGHCVSQSATWTGTDASRRSREIAYRGKLPSARGRVMTSHWQLRCRRKPLRPVVLRPCLSTSVPFHSNEDRYTAENKLSNLKQYLFWILLSEETARISVHDSITNLPASNQSDSIILWENQPRKMGKSEKCHVQSDGMNCCSKY